MTFLEVTLSVALFAGLVTTLFGAYESLRRWSTLDQERLNATEVAHKLILLYTHDGPDKLPDTDVAIEQGQGKYRYLLSEEILVERKGERDKISIREARPSRSLSDNERIGAGLVMITIKVYPDESTAFTDPSEPLASLSRVFDPFGSTDEDVLINHVLQLLRQSMPGGAPQPR
ncbi:MAG: hypothetical protein VYC34_05720 [Planctomycetota bacterium]|nr:hypothetical protein [Planctomycetota bacterium]